MSAYYVCSQPEKASANSGCTSRKNRVWRPQAYSICGSNPQANNTFWMLQVLSLSLSLTSRGPQPAEKKERYLRKAGHSPKRTLGKHSKFHCYLNGSKISILGNRMLVLVLKQKWSAEASPQRGEHQSIPSDPSLLFGAQSLLLNTKTKTNKHLKGYTKILPCAPGSFCACNILFT